MKRFILKRLMLMLPILLGISFLIFTIMHFTPGDPARMQLGEVATSEDIQKLRTEMGLDDGFFVRYFKYLKNAVKGDFGKSYQTNIPVSVEISSRVLTTLNLAFNAIVIAMLIGIPIGIISALNQYSWVDTISLGTALLLTSMPGFWLGLMLMIVFSVRLDWLPVTGADTWVHFILPSITLSGGTMAVLMRMTRTTMLEVIRQDYIRTAEAKGATEVSVVFKHALRNALLPVVTVIGINFGILMGGAIIIENVFAIPGIGSLLINSVKSKDIPLVMGIVLFIAIVTSIINLIIDLLYTYIDPRTKTQLT